MADTTIEWATRVWNPIRGCSLISAGCTNCYAMKQAHRFGGKGQPYEGLTRPGANGPIWTGEVRFVPEMLGAVLRWRPPARIFVNSMSDLFHPDVDAKDIATVFAVFAVADWHTFLTLTKRADRMEEVVGCKDFPALVGRMIDERVRPLIEGKIRGDWGLVSPTANGLRRGFDGFWPPPNWWAGVSVEDQANADARLAYLRDTPAVVRWASYEPAIGPLEIKRVHTKDGMNVGVDRWLSWLVAGGESGPDARPSYPDWFRKVRDDCVESNIKYFFKQWGAWLPTDQEMGRSEVGEGADDRKVSRALLPDGRHLPDLTGRGKDGKDAVVVRRVGKKAAGRFLDGKEWSQFPEVPRA